MIRATLLLLAACDTSVDLGPEHRAVREDPYESDTDTADPVWCRTLMQAEGGLALVAAHMPTASSVREAEWDGLRPTTETAGLATDGTTWVFPARSRDLGENRWHSVDAASGVVTVGESNNRVVSVGWSGTEWVARDAPSADGPPAFLRYATFADLSAYRPTGEAPSSLNVTRLTVHEGKIYGTWNSGGPVSVFDLLSGTLLDTITIDGWGAGGDAWIGGISVFDGRVYLSDGAVGDGPETRIASFDVSTGTLLDDVVFDLGEGNSGGLVCSATPSL